MGNFDEFWSNRFVILTKLSISIKIEEVRLFQLSFRVYVFYYK